MLLPVQHTDTALLGCMHNKRSAARAIPIGMLRMLAPDYLYMSAAAVLARGDTQPWEEAALLWP